MRLVQEAQEVCQNRKERKFVGYNGKCQKVNQYFSLVSVQL